jgi:sulfite dehydrogenase (cytochrome) subunit B
MKRIFGIAALGLTVIAADKGWKLPPENVALQKAPGVEVVTAQCALCHSLDYISIQPRMDRAAWMATITKMKDRYGAPVLDQSTNSLVEYLVKNYGAEKASATR